MESCTRQQRLVGSYATAEGAPADCPEGECDVSIECLRSSEFVVGKQTNFNGAITIINCTDAAAAKDRSNADRMEKIVIRNEVLTPTAPKQEGRREKLADVKHNLNKWRKLAACATSVVLCIGLLIATAFVSAVLLSTESAGGQNRTRTLYSKEDWQGKAAKSIVKMKMPVPYVVVSHTVTPLCHTLDTCAVLLRNMQSYHFSLEYADIGYNFLVDSGGNIYEGRGWERRNVKGGFVNGRNIDVALIGDYSDEVRPTEELMNGLRGLLDFALAKALISNDYALIAANSTYATLSPGKNVYSIIKHWPHFDPDPEAHVKEFEE